MTGTGQTETDPFAWFHRWMTEAEASEPSDPNAMTVVTVGPGGKPSARTILLKGVDPKGFVFFTNTHSRKGNELLNNPLISLLFYWKSLGRQIRIEGSVEAVTAAESDAYFATRPRISRLGAWASDQSRPLSDRPELERRLHEFEEKFPGEDIPRPPHWSGYRVLPDRFEFWQNMPFRLHDRTIFELAPGDAPGDAPGRSWICGKLFP
ncbi:MAG: pyridoxamine 5'-phosphate oxidase [Acetobacteraceae bacterium]|jgi:pyridoxamine 5'-phosphate oxidase